MAQVQGSQLGIHRHCCLVQVKQQYITRRPSRLAEHMALRHSVG